MRLHTVTNTLQAIRTDVVDVLSAGHMLWGSRFGQALLNAAQVSRLFLVALQYPLRCSHPPRRLRTATTSRNVVHATSAAISYAWTHARRRLLLGRRAVCTPGECVLLDAEAIHVLHERVTGLGASTGHLSRGQLTALTEPQQGCLLSIAAMLVSEVRRFFVAAQLR